MKKIISFITLSLFSLLTLNSCGQNQANTPQNSNIDNNNSKGNIKSKTAVKNTQNSQHNTVTKAS